MCQTWAGSQLDLRCQCLCQLCCVTGVPAGTVQTTSIHVTVNTYVRTIDVSDPGWEPTVQIDDDDDDDDDDYDDYDCDDDMAARVNYRPKGP